MNTLSYPSSSSNDGSCSELRSEQGLPLWERSPQRGPCSEQSSKMGLDAVVNTDIDKNNNKKAASKYIKNNDGNYVCPHCNKITQKQNTMHYHIRMNHTQDLPFECKRCEEGPKFLQKSSYLHHLATIHSDDLKLKDEEIAAVGGTDTNRYAALSFSCPSCEHKTHTKSNILIHYARTHCKDWIPSFIKDTACEGCDKVFKSSSAYLYHSIGCFRDQATEDQLNVISRIR